MYALGGITMTYHVGTRIYVETRTMTLEGTLADDMECLDGTIRVRLDDAYADHPGEVIGLRGWLFEADMAADGTLELYA